MSKPSCMVKVCVNSGVLVFFFLARMLSVIVYLFETKGSYRDAISKGFLGISLLPSRHTVPKVGVLRFDSDVERMRGHSSDHPIMPISWLLKIPCCELVDDRSTWLLTKPYHWFGHKRPSSGPWRWTLMFGQIHTFPSLSLSLWALWKMHIFTNSNSAKKRFFDHSCFSQPMDLNKAYHGIGLV